MPGEVGGSDTPPPPPDPSRQELQVGTPNAAPGPVPWMQQFLVNQSREIDLRFGQLELAQSQEQHGFEYAQQALTAQTADRDKERVSRDKNWGRTLFAVVTIIFLLLAFFATLTLTGNGQIALELAKVVIYGGLGAAGGYGYGKRQKPAG